MGAGVGVGVGGVGVGRVGGVKVGVVVGVAEVARVGAAPGREAAESQDQLQPAPVREQHGGQGDDCLSSSKGEVNNVALERQV